MWFQLYEQHKVSASLCSQQVIIVGSEGRGSWSCVPQLLRLAYPASRTELKNSDECDVIIRSHFLHDEPPWNKKKKKYILWSGEAYNVPIPQDNVENVLHITTVNSATNLEKNTMYVPYFLHSHHLNKPRLYCTIDSPYLVAYCSSNPVTVRENLYNEFVKQAGEEQCHSLGRCHGKYSQTQRRIGGGWTSDNLIEAYSQYKFGFAMENSDTPGYVTEKIVNIFRSGAIPIYWGTAQVSKFFNKNAFVYVNDFNSLSDCVNYVRNLSRDDRAAMLREPIYNDCDMIHLFDDNHTMSKLQRKYSATLRNFLQLSG